MEYMGVDDPATRVLDTGYMTSGSQATPCQIRNMLLPSADDGAAVSSSSSSTMLATVDFAGTSSPTMANVVPFLMEKLTSSTALNISFPCAAV